MSLKEVYKKEEGGPGAKLSGFQNNSRLSEFTRISFIWHLSTALGHTGVIQRKIPHKIEIIRFWLKVYAG